VWKKTTRGNWLNQIHLEWKTPTKNRGGAAEMEIEWWCFSKVTPGLTRYQKEKFICEASFYRPDDHPVSN